MKAKTLAALVAGGALALGGCEERREPQLVVSDHTFYGLGGDFVADVDGDGICDVLGTRHPDVGSMYVSFVADDMRDELKRDGRYIVFKDTPSMTQEMRDMGSGLMRNQAELKYLIEHANYERSLSK